MGRPDELLLRLRQVAGKAPDAVGRSQMRPSATSMCEKTSVTGNFLLLALRGFGLVGCECSDVDQGGDPVVARRA